MTKPKVLFIDDEPNILKAMRRIFREEGYELFFFDNPADALKSMAEISPAVIVSDQRMPGISGVELMEKARQVCPDAIRIILTAYTDIETVIRAINKGNIYRFIRKPWDDEYLRHEVKNAVNTYQFLRNRMTDSIQAVLQKKLSTERFRGIRELAGATCHEMNTPLQLAKGYTEILLEELPEGHRLNPFIRNLKNEIDLLCSTTKKLMTITRNEDRSEAETAEPKSGRPDFGA